MSIRSLLFFVALCAQAADLMITDPRWNGIELHLTAKLEPGGVTGIPGGVFTGPDRPHRLIVDEAGHRYYGYDLTVQVHGDIVTVGMLPLSVPPDRLFHEDGSSTWAKLGPASGMNWLVRLGDTLTVDLMYNPSTRQKIVEYITPRRGGYDHAVASRAPRDFALSDVELVFFSPHVSINGKMVEATAGNQGQVSGSTIWFYLPGKGRYIFSLLPHSELGFQKAGQIAYEAFTFTAGGDNYRVDCTTRIVPGGPFNLYVYPDPSWRPKGEDRYLVGAADRPESVIHR
jgi:hypothetical protein